MGAKKRVQKSIFCRTFVIVEREISRKVCGEIRKTGGVSDCWTHSDHDTGKKRNNKALCLNTKHGKGGEGDRSQRKGPLRVKTSTIKKNGRKRRCVRGGAFHYRHSCMRRGRRSYCRLPGVDWKGFLFQRQKRGEETCKKEKNGWGTGMWEIAML